MQRRSDAYVVGSGGVTRTRGLLNEREQGWLAPHKKRGSSTS
jgi:hypothetical protein